MNRLAKVGKKTTVLLLTGLLIALLSLAACAGAAGPAGPAGPPGPPGPAAPAQTASAIASPAAVELGMALLMTPVVFMGAGFAPGDTVVVEFVGIGEDGKDVAVSSATASDSGAFSCTMSAMAKIYDILHGKIDPATMKPAFEPGVAPLAPGVYTVKVTGFDSDTVVTCPFELKAPAAK